MDRLTNSIAHYFAVLLNISKIIARSNCMPYILLDCRPCPSGHDLQGHRVRVGLCWPGIYHTCFSTSEKAAPGRDVQMLQVQPTVCYATGCQEPHNAYGSGRASGGACSALRLDKGTGPQRPAGPGRCRRRCQR